MQEGLLWIQIQRYKSVMVGRIWQLRRGESAGIPVFVMSESHLDKSGSKKWNWRGK